MSYTFKHYVDAKKFILDNISRKYEMAIILGSGLSEVSAAINKHKVINYTDIVNFPKPTVKTHKGELIFGEINGSNIIVLNGRYHYYEGYDFDEVTFPIRVLSLIGVKKLIVTNAAGGINPNYEVGDLVLITDHIKLGGSSPLRGNYIKEFGERFIDMTQAYNLDLNEKLDNIAISQNIKMHKGVYAYMCGPQFETPAEIRALKILGCDLVGMSTVPEVIVANQALIKVCGISYVSNIASGLSKNKLSDDDVVKVGNRINYNFVNILKEFLLTN